MAADQPTDPLGHLSLPRLLFWALLLYLAWHWRVLAPVLTNGELPGPDDFLRLHQAKSWWLGQNWFDLKVHRLLGDDLHWSRIADLPLAAIAGFASWFTDATTAWRISAALWPLALFLAAIATLALLCDRLVGERARIFVLLFAGLNSFTMSEFAPGRIDHHNLQILLLLICLSSLFSRSPNRIALGVGIPIALSVSIGLEILVLFIPVLAGIALGWACNLNNGSRIMVRTGLVLGIAGLLLFGVTVPPGQYFIQHCDANSIVFLTMLSGIAGAFILLGSAHRLIDGAEVPSPIRRLVAGGLLAGLLFVLLVILFPNCLSGPLGGISQELHDRWLSNVVEAHGLIATANASMDRWLSGVAYLALMMCVALVVLWKHERHRPELLILFAVLIACTVASFWQMRVLRSGIFSAIPFTVLFAVMAMDWIGETVRRQVLRPVIQIFVCLVLTSYFWSLAATPLNPQKVVAADGNMPAAMPRQSNPSSELRNPGACFGAADMAELGNLPDGLVMADLNLAPSILIHTGHASVSGPYHRNGSAILSVYDFFQSPADHAFEHAEKLGIDYVATCRIDSGIDAVDAEHMNARIMRNDLPDWLQSRPGEGSRLLIFQIVK